MIDSTRPIAAAPISSGHLLTLAIGAAAFVHGRRAGGLVGWAIASIGALLVREALTGASSDAPRANSGPTLPSPRRIPSEPIPTSPPFGGV